MAEVPSQIDSICFGELASPVVLVEELLDEVVADHGQEVSIANRAVLGLRDKNFLLLFLLLISFLVISDFAHFCLVLLLRVISLGWWLRAFIRGSHCSIFLSVWLLLFVII